MNAALDVEFVGLVLIFSIGVVHYYCLVPIMSQSLFQAALMTAGASFFLFNIFFNYFLCISMDPGVVRQEFTDVEIQNYVSEVDSENDVKNSNDSIQRRHQRIPLSSEQDANLIPFTSYCKKCIMPRPARAHHCSVCKVCVLHMDHHCPWVNNCIGYYNYRYFFSFLFWLTGGCLYSSALTYYPLMYRNKDKEIFSKMNLLNKGILKTSFNVTAASMLSFTFSLCTAIGLAVGLLFLWHLYLVLSAQTTIEFYKNRSLRRRNPTVSLLLVKLSPVTSLAKALEFQKYQNPYASRSWRRNWEAVMGSQDFFRSFLPSTRLPPSAFHANSPLNYSSSPNEINTV